MNFTSKIDNELLSSLKYFYNLGDAVSVFIEFKNVHTELSQNINTFVQNIPQSIDANNNTQKYISSILYEDIITINKANENSVNPKNEIMNFTQDVHYSKKLTTNLFERFSAEQETVFDYKNRIDSLHATFDDFQVYFNQNPNNIYMYTNATINIGYKRINALNKIITDIMPLYTKLIAQHLSAINQLEHIIAVNNQNPDEDEAI